MIDRDLKKKLAQALGQQMFGSHFHTPSASTEPSQKGPLFEQMFQGLALMNRLEEIVTQSIRTIPQPLEPLAPEAPAEEKTLTFGTQYLSRHTQLQKRINESNRRMTQALLDLARKHMKSKTTTSSSNFSQAELTRYETKDTEIKRNSYFSKSTQTAPIYRPTARWLKG
jgi:hypothetical protein